MIGLERKKILFNLLADYCFGYNPDHDCRLIDGSKCPMKRRFGKCHLEHVRDIVRDDINKHRRCI